MRLRKEFFQRIKYIGEFTEHITRLLTVTRNLFAFGDPLVSFLFWIDIMHWKA
jgi:hypothetical protein